MRAVAFVDRVWIARVYTIRIHLQYIHIPLHHSHSHSHSHPHSQNPPPLIHLPGNQPLHTAQYSTNVGETKIHRT